MQIIIHTSGRPDGEQQHTLQALMGEGLSPTLVVQAKDEAAYSWWPKLFVLPSYINRLAETRDYIIHQMNGPDHVVFMDDDLDFAVRRTDDSTKFRAPSKENGDLKAMFDRMDRMLLDYPMVGIGAREGGNRMVEPYVLNSRIMRVLAFRRSYLQDKNLYFSPMVVMEDFHINLQILRSGADTCILNNWVSNQRGGSNAAGGCSEYRTAAVQTAAANKLAALHPGFVRVVQKATKTAWGGGVRTDVVVSWKAARKAALT